ncbi:MAG: ADP-ribosylglycohydrolase family protein [Bifidobacteriaceae bacterium]|nr:ADP-ribosylglycohydrolase family protein [Bifidobacteriaceae bacterium]
MKPDRADRALGALTGLAIGDALGMPTQAFSRPEVERRFGEVLAGFEPGPPDQPLAPGRAAGSVTDDTDQAMIVAELLIEDGGRIDPKKFASRLVAWEESMRRRGSLDLLGPSTRRAVRELLAGQPPDQTGRFGATNGAAMRIAPVGVASPPGPALLEAVVRASFVTHNTSVALAGAAAVAAAVSAAVDGAEPADAVRQGAAAAGPAARLGHWVAAADVATRIDWLVGALAPGRTSVLETIGLVGDLVGTSLATQESVPAAFACVLAFADDPWLAVRVAASAGGDCDTIAAMTGAILGACHGSEGFPAPARRLVAQVNGLDLEPVAAALLRLRERAGG